MERSIDQLVARLAGGEDLRAISRSLLPAGERELLRRCAAVRIFDDELFAAVLAAGIDGLAGYPPARLVAEGHAEPVPGPPGRYRLRTGLREDCLQEWWPASGAPQSDAPGGAQPEPVSGGGAPASLVEFNRQLADWYLRVGDQVEALYHLALADAGHAARLFADLYAAADLRFDLTRCQDLLDALSGPDRLPWLSPELGALRTDYDSYLRARTHWSAEWYQSARFLDRPALHDRLVALLEPRPSAPATRRGGQPCRTLQIYAQGGMGKTIQLRWFIARWCIPQPRRIPCARVDFDLVEPAHVSGYPWLLLLEFADQLNRQLPGRPFQELLAEHGVYRALLEQRPTAVTAAAASLLAGGAQAERLGRQVTFRFIRTLNDSAAGKPVVLIADTLEEVTLRPNTDPRRLLATLAEVRDACPEVRLILAGRYDLRESVSDLDHVLGPVDSVHLDRFTPGECASYLSVKRGERRPDLIGAMTAASRGLPFTLALLADAVVNQPEMDAAAVRGYDDPGLLYLIERIVTRIADPAVRWLLRYGVVPRRLSLDFIAEVMRPYLASGMSGTSDVDAPDRDWKPPRRTWQPFPTDVLPTAESPMDVAEVWANLLRYASDYSWVSVYAEWPDTVVFHPEVAEPMRRLLRGHEVYRRLHSDAAAYCVRRAAEDPGQWLSWSREAVYHRFQAEGPAAGGFWRQLLDEAAGRGAGAEWRGEIAAEILRREYLDERSQPRDWQTGVPMVSGDLLAEAHLEVAWSTLDKAERGRLGRSDPLLPRAAGALDRARAICAAQGLALPAVATPVEAKLRWLTGATAQAEALVRQGLAQELGDQDRSVLVELLADSTSTRDPDQAIALYRSLLDRVQFQQARPEQIPAERAGSESNSGRRIGQKLLRLLADRDRLDEAIAVGEAVVWTGMWSTGIWPTEILRTVLGQIMATHSEQPQPPTDADALALVEEGKLRLRAGMPSRLLIRATDLLQVAGDLGEYGGSLPSSGPISAADVQATAGYLPSTGIVESPDTDTAPDTVVAAGTGSGTGGATGPTAVPATIVAALHWCVAAARLAMRQPAAALDACRTAVSALGSPTTPEGIRLGIELREMRARVSAALLDIPEAMTQLEKAIAGWQELGETDRVCLATAIVGEFDPRAIGRLRLHINLLVEQAEQTGPEPGSEPWLILRLHHAAMLAEDGKLDEARGIVDAVLSVSAEELPGIQQTRGPGTGGSTTGGPVTGRPGSGGSSTGVKTTVLPPRLLVRIALAALAVAPPAGAGRYLDLLILGLNRIQPAEARLPLLVSLARCPAVAAGGYAGSALQELTDPADHPPPTTARTPGPLVPDTEPTPDTRQTERALRAEAEQAEWAARVLTLVEARRVLGRTEEAARLLSGLIPPANLGGLATTYAWWQWFDAANRVGPRSTHFPAVDPVALETAGENLWQYHVLSAAALVTLAVWRLDDDPQEVALRRLYAAERLLEEGQAEDTVWYIVLSVLRAAYAIRSGDSAGQQEHLQRARSRWARLGRRGAIPYLELANAPPADALPTPGSSPAPVPPSIPPVPPAQQAPPRSEQQAPKQAQPPPAADHAPPRSAPSPVDSAPSPPPYGQPPAAQPPAVQAPTYAQPPAYTPPQPVYPPQAGYPQSSPGYQSPPASYGQAPPGHAPAPAAPPAGGGGGGSVPAPLILDIGLDNQTIEARATWDSTRKRTSYRANVLFGATAPGDINDYQPYELIDRFLTNWNAAGRLLGKVLIPRRALTGASRRGRRDVLIRADHPLLAALPWELARPSDAPAQTLSQDARIGPVLRTLDPEPTDRATVLALQRTLRRVSRHELPLDGVFGQATRDALVAFQREAGRTADGVPGPATWQVLHDTGRRAPARRPAAVLVVRSSLERELSKGRGGRTQGLDVASAYTRVGFRVQTLENPDAGLLDNALRAMIDTGQDPAAVHICGGFGTSGTSVFMDFEAATETSESYSQWVGPQSSEALFVTSLDRALARLPADTAAPLVILDPDQPRSASEGFRQLLLRNAFAHRLLALGNVPVVLAIGLGADGPRPGQETVVETLAAGGSAMDTCRAYRSALDDRWRQAAAVWSLLPPYALPRTWVDRT